MPIEIVMLFADYKLPCATVLFSNDPALIYFILVSIGKMMANCLLLPPFWRYAVGGVKSYFYHNFRILSFFSLKCVVEVSR